MREDLYAMEPNALQTYVEQLIHIETHATPDERKLAAQMFPPDDDDDDDCDGCYDEDDDGAHIRVSGELSMNGPSGLAKLFGIQGGSYRAIQKAVARAAASPKEKVTLHFNSPGGEVAGVDQTWQAIRGLGKMKSTTGRVEGMCASAAYYLASGCSRIEATSPGDEIGSIGVKMVAYDDSEAAQKIGIKRVQIISKNAPNKNDDVADKAGRAALQSRVDAYERVFVSRVAEGRGVSEDTVREKFGRGGLMLAEDPDDGEDDALSTNMIDGVVDFAPSSAPAVPGPASRRWGARADNSLLASASGKSDYAIVDRPWDVNAANKRWREKSKSNDEPSPDYKDGFFWYDSADAKNYGAYKLQFVDVVDGKACAIRKAIFACNGAMSGARGGVDIPSKDRKAVQARIDGYLNKIKDEDEKSSKKDKGSASADGGKRMDLKEFLEDNPEAKADLEKLLASEREKFTSRIAAAKPFLSLKVTDGGYTKAEIDQIARLALSVVLGDEEHATLKSFVRLIDMGVEGRKQGATSSEVKPETPPQQTADITMAEAVAKLGQKRVDELKAYCTEHRVNLVGSLRAEIDHVAANNVAKKE